MSNSDAPAPTRWQRLQVLYDEALTMATAQRPQFVINSCGEDNILRDQLLSLLMQQPDAARTAFVNTSESADARLEPGYIVDRYRIVRQIGSGGMGVVYQAERANSEFEQKVALKLVNSNLISPNIVARLKGERQILANLNHPNIARLIDGGATANGIPYLVMEYVEGTRIDLYCSTHELNIPARLKLFQQVCAAVHAAHQQLIIHRDIKPSNILVTADGVPKLLDFGIAKLIDADTRISDTALTMINERMLTPEYASPEQIRGEPLGTASDVYALGVLLYELLTGTKPYRFKGGTLSQLEELIQSHTPTKPSVALEKIQEQSATGIDITLTRTLRGDLDTIVLKAMHKDIARRYGSASALADDIENYLANRPIAARPDSIGYIARKFWQRNRWVVSSVMIAVLVVIGLTIFYTLKLAAERDVAEREKLTATRVSQFMTEVFRVANPNESKANTVPVREVLDNAATRIDRELGSEPQVQIALLQKMAQAYIGIGLWNSAESLLTKAATRQRNLYGSDNLELAGILTALANVQHRRAQFDEERASLENALAIRHALHADHDSDTVVALVALSGNYANSGRIDPALQHLREAESITSTLPTRDSYILGKVYSGYGDAYFYVSRYKEAEEYYRKALPLLHGTIEQGADLYADTVISLASVLIGKSQPDDARLLLKPLITELEKRYDPNHPIISEAWNELGITYCDSGEYKPCSEAFRKSTDIEQSLAAHGSKRLAMMYYNLGSAYHDAGNLAAALNALATSIAMIDQLGDHNNPLLLNAYYNQAGVLRELGRFNEARKSLDAGDKVAQHYKDRHYPMVYAIMLERGRLLLAQKSHAAAIAELKKALQELPQEEQLLRASTQLTLGQALLATHQCDDAIQTLTAAYQIRRTLMPPRNWFIYEAENNLGNALSRCGDNDRAEPLLTDSVTRLRQLREKGDLRLAEAEQNLLSFEKRTNRRVSL